MLKIAAPTVELCVRSGDQVNKGRLTAGVDKLVVKTPEDQSGLVEEVSRYQPWKPDFSRPYIPNANGKARPLGIPTVLDRCMQAVAPECPGTPNGKPASSPARTRFRPGRGCHRRHVSHLHDCRNAQQVQEMGRRCRPQGRVLTTSGTFDHPRRVAGLEVLLVTSSSRWLKQALSTRACLRKRSPVRRKAIVSPVLLNIAFMAWNRPWASLTGNVGSSVRDQQTCSDPVCRRSGDLRSNTRRRGIGKSRHRSGAHSAHAEGLELSPEKTAVRHLTS